MGATFAEEVTAFGPPLLAVRRRGARPGQHPRPVHAPLVPGNASYVPASTAALPE